jgi:hypothetical protein
MDPRIQEAAALIQKMMEVIAMMAEEIQNLKASGDGKKKEDNQSDGIQKQASYSELTAIAAELSVHVSELPEFVKTASVEQFNAMRDRIISINTGDDLTKTAFISDGTGDDFDLNVALSNIAYN